MRKTLASALCLMLGTTSFSQVRIGAFGGIANYLGDLTDGIYVGKLARPAVGLTGSYELSERIWLRGGLTFAKVSGNDRYQKKDYLRARNLNFSSPITEFSIAGEFHTFSLYDKRWSPYVMVGLAFYRFNPYTYNTTGDKVYLRPLSTEGEGLPGYTVKNYSRTQLALPFGAGVKFSLNENVLLGAELGIRKLFTDYLDDVSGNFAGASDLLTYRGQQAVDFSYRADELPGGDPNYPAKGAQRGNAKQKDWYYLTGLTLSYRLHSRDERRSQLRCPSYPM